MRVSTTIGLLGGTGAAVLATDLTVKGWFREHVPEGARGPRIGPFETEHLQHPMGVANGYNDGSRRNAVTSLALVMPAVAGAGILAGHRAPGAHGPIAAVGAGLVIGAALSNPGEMLVRESVTDYVRSSSEPGEPYVVYNLADVAAATGAALLGGSMAVGLGQTAITAFRAAR